MKELLHKDSIILGIVATLVSELLCAALVWIVIAILQVPFAENARWFAIAFVPPLLLLRYYAKVQDYPTTLKAVITTFFVTFVIFMWVMLKYRYISF
jgi:RsiW-degrading membrane proteinase PrsW (M82 family)